MQDNKTKTGTDQLTRTLMKIPGVVAINRLNFEGKMIEAISLEKDSLGNLELARIRESDASLLFSFYTEGLSDKARNFFPPYPLFNPAVYSANELSKRIKDWQQESDWTVLKLTKDSEVIGICLLKRFSTERPTSGLAVREKFQNNQLGFLMQSVVNEQARLLGLPILFAGASPENAASLRLHLKCGFKETGRLVPHFVYNNGVKKIDRNDVELILELI